ncbi:MAG: ThiF family adenylyltransferase [Candidatus Heimdallarchaeaceae archaeon]
MENELWYKKDKGRLKKERERVKKKYPQFELKKDNETLYWQGEVEINGEKHKLKIIYPFLYPYQRPRLYVITENNEILMNFQTSHQLRDGSICLFTYDDGPNGWKWDYTVEEVINKFCQFLIDRGKSNFEAKHSSFYSRFYGIKETKIIVLVPAEFKSFILQYRFGKFIMKRVYNNGRFFVVDKIYHDKKYKDITNSKEWEKIITLPDEINGFWYYIKKPIPTFDLIKTNKTLINMIERICKIPRIDGQFPLLICYKSGRDYALIGYKLNLKEENVYHLPPRYFDVEFTSIYKDTFKRTKKVIKEGLDMLNNKTIIGIGLGSIGSSILLELSKSGVGNFILFDPDIVEFSNLSKHACDLRHIGMLKVEAMKDLLWRRNVRASIEGYDLSPLDERIINTFIECIKKENSIAVIAIAEHETEGALNRLLVKYNCPAIYVTALDNGYYGRVFRVIPYKTPCYECISIWNEEKPEEYPSLKTTVENEQGSLGEFYAYRHPGFPGISVDVNFISLLAARLTLQTLLRNTSAIKLYPDIEYHHFIWSNREGWIFNQPLQLKVIDYPMAVNCPVCGGKK